MLEMRNRAICDRSVMFVMSIWARILFMSILQIPQACPAEGSVFPKSLNAHLVRLAAGFTEGKSGGHATVVKRRFVSEKPKLPQGKPVGFLGKGDSSDGVLYL